VIPVGRRKFRGRRAAFWSPSPEAALNTAGEEAARAAGASAGLVIPVGGWAEAALNTAGEEAGAPTGLVIPVGRWTFRGRRAAFWSWGATLTCSVPAVSASARLMARRDAPDSPYSRTAPVPTLTPSVI